MYKILHNMQLSLTTEWEVDDDFHLAAPPTEPHSMPCSSMEWLEHHGLECKATVHGADTRVRVLTLMSATTFCCAH